MPDLTQQALRAANSTPAGATAARQPTGEGQLGRGATLVVGAGGALGRALVEQLVRTGGAVQVPVRAAVHQGLAGVHPVQMPRGHPADFTVWPLLSAGAAVVHFDRATEGSAARSREGVFWSASASDLVALAHWLRSAGVATLVVVQPHAAGRLPDALKRGLANRDEHALAMLGFDRLLLLRQAHDPLRPVGRSPLERLAAAMLGIFGYMIPGADRPVRAAKVAEVVDALLAHAPPGVHVVAPESLSEAAQARDTALAVAAWFSVSAGIHARAASANA